MEPQSKQKQEHSDNNADDDLMELISGLNLQELAISPEAVIDPGDAPVIEEFSAAQKRSPYYTINHSRPVTLLTDYGVIRIEPRKGCSSGQVLQRAWESVGGLINSNTKVRYSARNPLKIKYYKLWCRHYRDKDMCQLEVAKKLMEELPSTLSPVTLQTWISYWLRGKRMPLRDIDKPKALKNKEQA